MKDYQLGEFEEIVILTLECHPKVILAIQFSRH
jgi:hypothetical protein